MSTVDWERSASLSAAGAPEYVAAVAITSTGDEALWLVSMSELEHRCAQHARHGNADQPHERIGRLPRRVYDAIWSVPTDDDESTRCGRPRADGQPCRQRVSEPGAACCFHSNSDVQP